jgi:hypothetical protein
VNAETTASTVERLTDQLNLQPGHAAFLAHFLEPEAEALLNLSARLKKTDPSKGGRPKGTAEIPAPRAKKTVGDMVLDQTDSDSEETE